MSRESTKHHTHCTAPCRLYIFYADWHGVKDLLQKVQTLCEEGGDWERKNRLKVRSGVYVYTHTRTQCCNRAGQAPSRVCLNNSSKRA